MDLHTKLSSTLRDQMTFPWLPQISEELVNSSWKGFYAESGYTAQNYSTSRMIERNVHAERNVLGTLVFDDFGGKLILEKLANNNEAAFEALGLCFPPGDQTSIDYHLSELKLAFKLIANIPSLYITVLTLVRSIHVLKAVNDEHDVSFSDPSIPFSIFVSIPAVHDANTSIRLAEAIIHEAMHLQLTLIESYSPLILEDSEKLFSPWKNEIRRPSGIFHALYVFAVIYTALPLLCTSDEEFVTRRGSKIKNQILEIDSFRLMQGFTPLGKIFRDNLFVCFDKPIPLDGLKKP